MLTVLAVGSKRVRGLFNKLEILNSFDVPLQLAIVAGGDHALFDKARAVRWNVPVFCYNYVGNLPEMLLASDVLITKAGGLITGEALACGLPIIYTEALPGQETGNVKYVCDHSAGVMAKTSAELKETLSTWIRDDRKVLAQFACNARAIGKPDAAYQINREIWKAILNEDRNRVQENSREDHEPGPSVWES